MISPTHSTPTVRLSVLFIVYAPNAVITIMMFDADKTSVSVRNILNRFIQPGQNVSLQNSSTLTLTLNAQQNAALLMGSVDEEDRCKFAVMYSKTICSLHIFKHTTETGPPHFQV
jgi:hypothetical protein